MAKRILKILSSPFLGKRFLQPLYSALHFLALKGMNFGRGADFKSSGELVVLDYVKKSLAGLNREAVIFDVGANVGNYSLAAAGIFAGLPAGFVIYAFEPSLRTFEKLKNNVSKLQCVQAVNAGLSDKNARAILYSDSEFSGLSSLNKRQLQHVGLVMNLREEVSLVTLDDYCARQGIAEVDFLKLDVEGHELLVLNGAGQMLASGKIRFIQFEFGGCNIDSRTFFRDFYYLLSSHYRISRVLKDGLYPILAYRETDEIFITTNYFAELKGHA
jgi:FkbM family methyltransferase